MFHRRILTAVFSVALPLIMFCAARASDDALPGLEGIPEVVAEVDGVKIGRNELIRELVGSSGSKALERLIDRTLVEQMAAKQGIVVTPQDIDAQFNLDKRDLAASLIHMFRLKEVPIEDIVRARFGMSLEEYKDTVIRQRLLARRCLASNVVVTEADLHRYFDAHRDKFQPPVSYRAAHILITPLDPRDFFSSTWRTAHSANQYNNYVEKMRAKQMEYQEKGVTFEDNYDAQVEAMWRKSHAEASRIARDLQINPGRWNDYVAKFSQDVLDKGRRGPNGIVEQSERAKARLMPGELPVFTKFGPLMPDFYEGVKDLRAGQITDEPVRTQYGYHIVRMIDVQQPALVSFEQLRDRVRREYIDSEIELRSEAWMAQMARSAEIKAAGDFKNDKATLWPPRPPRAENALDPQSESASAEDRDPVLCRVNGVELHRSAVWRELLRTEGEEALKKLINREVVLNILKVEGLARTQWRCSSPSTRPVNAPQRQPIVIPQEMLQVELNADRLQHDQMLERKEYAHLSFGEFIYRRYGQSEAEYKRALEASLILREAIRRKIIPRDPAKFEQTLRFEFALAKEQYSEPATYEVSHILKSPPNGMLNSSRDDVQAAALTADNIYRMLLAQPEKFPELVEQFSDDTPENKAANGSLGKVYRDFSPPELPESRQFYLELEKLRLEPGQFSPPIKSLRGFHVLRLDKRLPAQEATFQEKRAQIEKDYVAEQARYYVDIWVRSLNSQAIVKHFLYKNLPDEKQELNMPEHFPLPKD